MTVKQRLADYSPIRRMSGMDKFFKAGKKAYGITNEDAYALGKYSTQGKSKKPSIFDIVEYFGTKRVSKGGNIDTKKNKELSQMAKILSKEAPKGHILAYITPEEAQLLKDRGGSGEKTKAGIPTYRYGGHHGDPAGTGTGAQGPAGGQSSGGNYGGGGDTSGNAGSSGFGSNTTSVRDSGMVSTSTGYGPLGAGGEALGPDGNQGGGSYNTDDNDNQNTFSYNDLSTYSHTYSPPKDKSLFSIRDDGWGLNEDGLGFADAEKGFTVGVTGSLNSVNAGFTQSFGQFKKGGLLDTKRFKKA